MAGAAEGSFDFGRVDIFAAADDFVAGAACDVELASGGEVAEVVCVEGLGGEGWAVCVVVAVGDRLRTNNYAPEDTRWLLLSVYFDRDFGVGKGRAAAWILRVDGFGLLDGDHGGGFGHAVGEADGDLILDGLGEETGPGGGSA